MSSIRTPPSLSWLINKRARLQGEIIKLEESHSKNVDEAKKRVVEAEMSLELAKQDLVCIETVGPRMIEALRIDLQSVDNTLGLHEIQINPDIIPPICTPDADGLFAHGELTSTIFECFKLAGGRSVSTLEITDFVAIKIGVELTSDNYQIFRKKISWRLKNLCADGKIRRLHQVKGAVVGRWALPDDLAELDSTWHPKWGRPRKKQD